MLSMDLALFLVLCTVHADSFDARRTSCLHCEEELVLLQTGFRATQRSGSSGTGLTDSASLGAADVTSLNEDSIVPGQNTKTGEAGELVYHPFSHPHLSRTSFYSKGEKELASDRRVLQEQMVVDRMHVDAEEALAKLKAGTYQSADFSRWRGEQQMDLATAKQRMQLLAAVNMEKATTARAASDRAKIDSFYEKSLHDSQDAISRESARRELVWLKELKDQTADNHNRSHADMVEKKAWESLGSDRRNIKDWEKFALQNMTAGLEGAGYNSTDEGMEGLPVLAGSLSAEYSYDTLLDAVGLAGNLTGKLTRSQQAKLPDRPKKTGPV